MSHTRATVALRQHQRTRLTCTANGVVAGMDPTCIETPQGEYLDAYVNANQVWVRYSEFSNPPFFHTTAATSGEQCLDPCLSLDFRGRLLLLYTDSATTPDRVLLRVSDDDGLTHTAAVALFDPGQYPRVATAENGDTLFAAYSANKLYGRFQAAGDTAPAAAFTFKDSAGADLNVADDRFDIAWAYSNANEWVLHYRANGATGTTVAVSYDDAQTWQTKV